MKLQPNLIPRFNIDYDTNDVIDALTTLKTYKDISPLSSIFKDSYINFTNSGRTSLYVILKALQLPKNSKIGVPLFTCTSVFDAIINAGYRPVFIDIDPKNYTLDPYNLSNRINELDAVIVIHTFGRPADMDKIRKISGNIPIIEDCAHALLSKYNGEMTGTIGNAAFFSFRNGKYISAGEGGMIVTKDPELSKEITRTIEQLPTPSIINELKSSIASYARSTLYHKPWFGLVSLPIGSLIENKIDLMNKHDFKTTKIRKSDLCIILKKIKNFKDKVNLQRINSKYLIGKINNPELLLPIEASDTFCNYYLFPVQFKNRVQRDIISNQLRNKGIDTAKLFSQTPDFAKKHYSYKGDCPNSEQVAERLLTVPNYYTLNIKDLNKISQTINLCPSTD